MTRGNSVKLRRADLDWMLEGNLGEALAQLPREAVDTPSLEMLKASLDGALGILIW